MTASQSCTASSNVLGRVRSASNNRSFPRTNDGGDCELEEEEVEDVEEEEEEEDGEEGEGGGECAGRDKSSPLNTSKRCFSLLDRSLTVPFTLYPRWSSSSMT